MRVAAQDYALHKARVGRRRHGIVRHGDRLRCTASALAPAGTSMPGGNAVARGPALALCRWRELVLDLADGLIVGAIEIDRIIEIVVVDEVLKSGQVRHRRDR